MVRGWFVVVSKAKQPRDFDFNVSELLFVREPQNVYDPSAIIVQGLASHPGGSAGNFPSTVKILSGSSKLEHVSGSQSVLGYLRRHVSAFLAPLLDRNLIEIDCLDASCEGLDNNSISLHLDFKLKPCPAESMSEWNDLETYCQNSSLDAADSFYQDRFVRIFEDVRTCILNHWNHLFSEKILNLLKQFQHLDMDAKRLFCRLFQRRHGLIEISKIDYPEVLNHIEAVFSLIQHGFLVRGSLLISFSDQSQIIDTLQRQPNRSLVRLLESIGNFGIKRGMAKSEILQKLDKTLFGQKDLYGKRLIDSAKIQKIFLEKLDLDQTIQISEQIYKSFQSMYSLGLFDFDAEMPQQVYASLSLHMQKTRFPPYSLSLPSSIFKSVLEFEDFVQFSSIKRKCSDLLENRRFEEVLRLTDSIVESCFERLAVLVHSFENSFMSRFTPQYTVVNILTYRSRALHLAKKHSELSSLLERLLACNVDLSITKRRRGEWWNKLALIHDCHCKDKKRALDVCHRGLLDDSCSTGEHIELEKRYKRLLSSLKVARNPSIKTYMYSFKTNFIECRGLNSQSGKKLWFNTEDGDPCSVEDYALEHYAKTGNWIGYHCEGGILLSLFAIVCWDIIFADLPQVFVSPFQDSPLDLLSADFLTRRESMFACLEETMTDSSLKELISLNHSRHHGFCCRGMHWDIYSLADLCSFAEAIGFERLLAICRLLASNYRVWASGMPDLALWRQNERGEKVFKMVEVKSENDRLSFKQIAWMLELEKLGIDVEVCKVASSRKTSKRKRKKVFQEDCIEGSADSSEVLVFGDDSVIVLD